MLVADLRAVLDDVHDRHRVPAPEVVVLLQPVDDVAGLRLRPEAALVRERDELARCEPRLVLDGVEVRLERHDFLQGRRVLPAAHTRWTTRIGATHRVLPGLGLLLCGTAALAVRAPSLTPEGRGKAG